MVTAKELVEKFFKFSEVIPDLNVFHLCGGDPARYANFWPELRDALDATGLSEVVLLSDTIFVENFLYHIKPWQYVDLHHFTIAGCLKGTTRKNFLVNTQFDFYKEALQELIYYAQLENFWLTLIKYDVLGLPVVFDKVPFEKIDFLNVVNYAASYKSDVHV